MNKDDSENNPREKLVPVTLYCDEPLAASLVSWTQRSGIASRSAIFKAAVILLLGDERLARNDRERSAISAWKLFVRSRENDELAALFKEKGWYDSKEVGGREFGMPILVRGTTGLFLAGVNGMFLPNDNTLPRSAFLAAVVSHIAKELSMKRALVVYGEYFETCSYADVEVIHLFPDVARGRADKITELAEAEGEEDK